MRRRWCAIAMLFLLAAWSPPAFAQRAADDAANADAAAPNEERARQGEVAILAPAKAKQLQIRVGDDESEAAKLHAEPLLRWSNATVGSVYGEVFLWHDRGRPVALASIFRWYHPFRDATLEIASLSPQPVSAREGDKVEWDCRSPGVAYHALAEAPAPAGSRGGRMSQMRAIARRFSARLIDERGGEDVERELRLLNQPLHRYESGQQKITDGALFAFAEATDPEVILLVEAAGGADDGAVQWRYALARMNNHELAVMLDDQNVQSWPRIHDPWKDRRANYTLFSFDPAAVKTQPPDKP